jgi:hypothetical protein
VDCDEHGEDYPAFRDWDGADGDNACLKCRIDELQALWIAGGEEDWEWVVRPPRTRLQIQADKHVAEWWSRKMADDVARYKGSVFAPFMRDEGKADE